MIWDYWLNEAHDDCGDRCASPLHSIFEAHMAPPSGSGSLTSFDKILVRMFEIRTDLEFSIDAVLKGANAMSDLEQPMAMEAMQQMPQMFEQFTKFHDGLIGSLGGPESISHLMPISERVFEIVNKMPPDLRNFVVHPETGLFGVASKLEKNAARRSPENSFLVCTGLIITFIDGLMHTMPRAFGTALGKTQSNQAPIRLYDARSLRNEIAAYNQQNPVHLFDFAGMGATSPRLASELMRMRWALRVSFRIYQLVDDFYTIARRMSGTWRRLQHQRIVHYSKIAVTELSVFIDVYENMCKTSSRPPEDDNVIKSIFAHKDEIKRLRNMVLHQRARDDYVAFSAALEAGIGSERLLFLSAIASDWARENANHYQDTCDDSVLVDGQFDIERRYDLVYIEREMAMCRKEAHKAHKERGSSTSHTVRSRPSVHVT